MGFPLQGLLGFYIGVPLNRTIGFCNRVLFKGTLMEPSQRESKTAPNEFSIGPWSSSAWAVRLGV